MTLNARPGGEPAARRSWLEQQVGADKVPIDVTEKDLAPAKFAALSKRIVLAEIQDLLSQRNGVLGGDERLNYQTLFNFRYADGVEMVTAGGIISRAADQNLLERCRFAELQFVTDDAEFRIEVPDLSFREVREIDAKLPQLVVKDLEHLSISDTDISNYATLYRYFPSFAEAEL